MHAESQLEANTIICCVNPALCALTQIKNQKLIKLDESLTIANEYWPTKDSLFDWPLASYSLWTMALSVAAADIFSSYGLIRSQKRHGDINDVTAK